MKTSNFAKLSENKKRVTELCKLHIMNVPWVYLAFRDFLFAVLKKAEKGETIDFDRIKNSATAKRIATLSLKSVKATESHIINVPTKLSPAMSIDIREFIVNDIIGQVEYCKKFGF